MIITIDGPAAAGKGTLAGKLAEKYKLAYFDTGMTYRAVGLELFLQGKDVTNVQEAAAAAKNLTFQRMHELAQNPEFRSSIGGANASKVSAIPEVRETLTEMMRDFAKNPVFADGTVANGVVYDGRDTGTVVCPQAEIKFYITASPEVRAMRRYKEFAQKGTDKTYEQVLADVIDRDNRDMNRSVAPLKPAADAHIFDTSTLTIEEVYSKACEIINRKQA